MRNLTEEEIDFIHNDIRRRGVFMKDLEANLLDHICCFIEEQPDDGKPFGQVYSSALEAFGHNGLQAIQDETLFLIHEPQFKTMKKIAYITGMIASMSLVFGAVFKLLHWPGANILLMTGTLTLTFLFIPYFFYSQFKEQTEKKGKIISGLGLATAMLLCCGAFFKLMHWPGASFMIVGFAVFFLIFLPLYVIDGIRNPLTRTTSISNSFIFASIGGFVLLLSFQNPSNAVTQSMETIGKNEQAYLVELKTAVTAQSDSTGKSKALIDFSNECETAILKLQGDDQSARPDNGTPVSQQDAFTLNNTLQGAVNKLNTTLSSDPSWKAVKFENIQPALFGSLRFQVMQLECRVLSSGM